MTSPAPEHQLSGDHVYRVVSQLGTDLLVGYCWCGASHAGEDPVELWQWLLAHPDTHGKDGTTSPGAPATDAPEAVQV